MNRTIADQAATMSAQSRTIGQQGSIISQLENTVEAQGSIIEAILARMTAVETAATDGEARTNQINITVQDQGRALAAMNISYDDAQTTAILAAAWGPAASAVTGDDSSRGLPTVWTPVAGTLELALEHVMLLSEVEVIRGHLMIDASASPIASVTSVFPRLRSIEGDLTITGTTLEHLDDAFPFLESVNGRVLVEDNMWLESVNGSFPLLETVNGSIVVTGNAQLQTLDASFPLLETVNGSVTVANNARLQALDGLLPLLESVRSVAITNNVALESFTDSFNSLVRARTITITNRNLGVIRSSFAAVRQVQNVAIWGTRSTDVPLTMEQLFSAHSGLSACLGSATVGFYWNADSNCHTDSQAAIEAIYEPPGGGPGVFKLSARSDAPASDGSQGSAAQWYQERCATVGLVPVMCGLVSSGDGYSGNTGGSTYDFTAYGAVGLPYSIYSCNLSSQIMALTGWTNVITFLDSSYPNDLCYNGCTAHDNPIHPICALP